MCPGLVVTCHLAESEGGVLEEERSADLVGELLPEKKALSSGFGS